MENEIRERIIGALEDNPQGLTMSDISNMTSLSRLTVSKYIYGLIAENKVELRNVGSAKLCCLKVVYA
ncbi:MAG: winged helix-turn-helix transcriptional regulator [Candidatus Aenigmatarchaeota archaeon]